MDSEKLKLLFCSIKNDDVKQFSTMIQSKMELKVCYGRFPILSLCYLYKSYRIIDEYEEALQSVKEYDIVSEYYEIYLEFKKYAKKSIRLYMNGKIVSPLEMLAIIDDREMIAKKYEKLQKDDKTTENIVKIYSLTNKTEIIATKDEFKAPKKNLSHSGKLLLSSIAIFMCFMIVFPIFSILGISMSTGLGVFSSPIHISNERELLSALNENSKCFVLDNDIELSSEISIDKFSGTINGNGKKIIAGSYLKSAMINNLTGSIENLKIEIDYEKLEITENLAFLANNLTGKIKNCEISGYIDGEFLIEDASLDDETTNDNGTYFSIFVMENNGTIENSSLNVSVNFDNDSSSNAFLSGFSAINNGNIISCNSSNESYIVDTIDIACFSINNNGTINGCENNLELKQSSSSESWNPNTAGMVITNNGIISNCINNGDIFSVSTNEIPPDDGYISIVYSSGIAIHNNGTIKDAINNGKIIAKSLVAETYSSGIVSRNNKELVSVINNGDIYASSEKLNVFAAGIACYNSFTYNIIEQGFMKYFEFVDTSSILNAENSGSIEANSLAEFDVNDVSQTEIKVYAGGIVGFNYTYIEDSQNYGNIKCDGKSAILYVGGIVGNSDYLSTFTPYLPNYSINNNYSKSTITATSSFNISFIGGICGYNNSANTINCGFEGKITSNSNETYAGGIIGSCYIATVHDNYASTNFANENLSTDNCYFAGIVGYYRTNFYINSSNNAYVGAKDTPAMNVLTVTSDNVAGLMGLSAEECGSKLFSSMQELLEYRNSNNMEVG